MIHSNALLDPLPLEQDVICKQLLTLATQQVDSNQATLATFQIQRTAIYRVK